MSKFLSKFNECINNSGFTPSYGNVAYDNLCNIISNFDYIAKENEIEDVKFILCEDFIVMEFNTLLLSDYENRERLSTMIDAATKFEIRYDRNEECKIMFYFNKEGIVE